MSATNQIWTRQKGERSKAYSLFCIYRDDGINRSLEKVKKKYCKTEEDTISISYIMKLSANNDWVERAEAYDDYLEEKTRLENEAEITKMNERHAKDALEIQNKSLESLRNRLPLADTKASPEARRNSTVKSWEVGVKNERLARGMATDKIEQSGTIKQRHSGNVSGNEILRQIDPDYLTAKRKAMDELHGQKQE
jgi:hypothetical protein